jgi:hypothetical protein
MGEPVGKASGRTFKSNGHLHPRPLLEFTIGDILHSPTICKPTTRLKLVGLFCKTVGQV